MELVEKVRSLLSAEFPPPSTVSLEDDDGDGIIGIVTSPRFYGMETLDRINIIWDLLGQHLSPEERRRVLTIVAVTPEDAIAHSA